MTEAPYIHPTAVVDAGAELGAGVKVWHFCHVMAGARIGEGSMLGQGCFVGTGVSIGRGVRVQNHVSVFEGVTLEDDVFVGPSVVFANVGRPRAFRLRARGAASTARPFDATLVRRGATLGANATVLPGVEVGEYALVGAGAVVSRHVASYALVTGVPARRVGWVSRAGERLDFVAGTAVCCATGERYVSNDAGVEPAPSR